MFDEPKLAPEMGCKMVDCKKTSSEFSHGLTCIGLRFTTEAMAKECHLLSQLSADGIWLTVHQHRQKRGVCAEVHAYLTQALSAVLMQTWDLQNSNGIQVQLTCLMLSIRCLRQLRANLR